MKHAITDFLGNTAALVVGLSAITTGGAAFAGGDRCGDDICGPSDTLTHQPGHSEITETNTRIDTTAVSAPTLITEQGQAQTVISAPELDNNNVNITEGDRVTNVKAPELDSSVTENAIAGSVEFVCGDDLVVRAKTTVGGYTKTGFSAGGSVLGTGIAVSAQYHGTFGDDQTLEDANRGLSSAADVMQMISQMSPRQLAEFAAACNGPPTQPHVPQTPQPIVPAEEKCPIDPTTQDCSGSATLIPGTMSFMLLSSQNHGNG